MYCPKCGKEQKEGAKFCPQCGTPVAAGAQKPKTELQKVANEKPAEKSGSGNNGKGSEIPEKSATGTGKHKIVLIATLVGIILIVSALAAAIILFKGPSGSGQDKEKPETQSESTEEIESETAPEILESSVAVPESVQTSAAGNDISAPFTESGAILYDESGAVDGNSVSGIRIQPAEMDMAGLYKLSYVSSTESSHVQQSNKIDNTAKSAMDNDEITSWQEGVAGSGINEWILYEFDRDYEIRYVSFKLGNWRNDRYFYGNNRPRRLKINVSGYETEIELPAEKEEYWVELAPACTGKQIIFSIEDVYRGTGEYDDTCIAEIGVYGK